MSDSHRTTTLITTTTTPSALYIPWLSNDQCRGGVVVATTRCCVDAMTQARCVCAGDRGAQGLARRGEQPILCLYCSFPSSRSLYLSSFEDLPGSSQGWGWLV